MKLKKQVSAPNIHLWHRHMIPDYKYSVSKRGYWIVKKNHQSKWVLKSSCSSSLIVQYLEVIFCSSQLCPLSSSLLSVCSALSHLSFFMKSVSHLQLGSFNSLLPARKSGEASSLFLFLLVFIPLNPSWQRFWWNNFLKKFYESSVNFTGFHSVW